MKSSKMVALLVLALAAVQLGSDAVADGKKKKSATEIAALCERSVVLIRAARYDENGIKDGWEQSGAGCFVAPDHVLTNLHVVHEKQVWWESGPDDPRLKTTKDALEAEAKWDYSYLVTIGGDRESHEAELVGYEPANDEAVLRVYGLEEKSYRPMSRGDPRKLKPGNKVYAIGCPFGERATISEGIVGALNNPAEVRFLGRDTEVTAAVDPGNSGGPLVNEYGELVGIVYAGRGQRGYAISSKPFKLERFLQGEVQMGYFGMEYLVEPPQSTPSVNDLENLRYESGRRDTASLLVLRELVKSYAALVTKVAPGAPAADAKEESGKLGGLKKGDIIYECNGALIADGVALREAFRYVTPEKPAHVHVLRVKRGEVEELAFEVKPLFH